MRISSRGNRVSESGPPDSSRFLKRSFVSGSILVDAIVGVVIVATLGVAIIAAVSNAYNTVALYDHDLRGLVDQIRVAYTSSW